MAETAKPGNGAGVKRGRLRKELGLWDVYCISTGAMFSSGFFLLPGLATAYAGPSTAIAYLIAGLLMVPAMLSMAELSTALPRAGGTYYFLDRSLGPAVGTIGGLGTWLALVLKSGFALLGMGAYLAITPGIGSLLPADADDALWIIKLLAIALTLLFAAVNIFGAKETTRLQGLLVIALLGILAFFVIQGLWYVHTDLPEGQIRRQFTPLLSEEHGLQGLIGTVGLVFVSYAGLTKVASVSEEVKQPDRNLPLGMILSLITATTVYVVGVYIMIAVLDREALRSDYTPVATAADAFFGWLPEPVGLILIIVAALAAFASTGNAGILSASRYPLAMARDRLIPDRFERLGRFGTPTAGIIATSGLMIFFILVLSAEGVAKIASAFNLFVFGLVNVAVIVMRESRIESYDPGFRSPLYPWTQIGGILIAVWLIAEMGALAIIASLVLALFGAVWYVYYARPRVVRFGAIHHIFERLGRQRFEGLDREFRDILKEKGARDEDPFDDVVARAKVVDADEGVTFDQVVQQAADILAERVPLDANQVYQRFMESARFGFAPISHNAMLPHFRLPDLDRPHLVLARSKTGVSAPIVSDGDDGEQEHEVTDIYAVFFLVSPEDNPGQHLRILAQIAGRLENEGFIDEWRRARDEQRLKECLLRDERFLALRIRGAGRSSELRGMRLRDIKWPEGTLVTMVRRDGQIFAPRGSTVLQEDDRLTIIGEPDGIAELYDRFIAPHQDPGGEKQGSISAQSTKKADRDDPVEDADAPAGSSP